MFRVVRFFSVGLSIQSDTVHTNTTKDKSAVLFERKQSKNKMLNAADKANGGR